MKKQDVCKSKRTFDTEEMAKTVISLGARANSRDYYLCEVCKKFHIHTVINDNNIYDKKLKKELRFIRNTKKRNKTKPKRKGRK